MTSPLSSLRSLPVLLVGFRPFFTLAFVAGALLPLLWALFFAGVQTLPPGGLSPVQWHAHEMLYGFGWAVLGGFLLTASKNWVGIRGLHGGGLLVAALLWLLERGVLWWFPADASLWWYPAASLFLLYVAGYVLWTLVRFRRQDSFRDNYFFLIALPLFVLAKLLLLYPDTFVQGYALAIGLFRVAFVVMFERTMTAFMKNAQGIALLRHPGLDQSIKVTVLLAAFAGFVPGPLAALLPALAGLLLLVRWLLWKPLAGLSRFDTGTMYAGYLGLVLHLGLEALRLAGVSLGLGAVSVHVFTFLCMGIIIPAMMIRISQGHTGRKILFTRMDRVALGCMGAGALLRLVAPQLWPAQYSLWVTGAALGWSACFVLVGGRLLPFLWQPRVDGKTH